MNLELWSENIFYSEISENIKIMEGIITKETVEVGSDNDEFDELM